MKKIFKYPIPVTNYFSMPTHDRFTIFMPEYAKILSVQLQKEKPFIWALIDETEKLRERHFGIFTTGEPIILEKNLPILHTDYIGTIQILNDSIVFHLFDLHYMEQSTCL